MKKLISLMLVISCLCSFASCVRQNREEEKEVPREEYTAFYCSPGYMITEAPETVPLDWDIKSVNTPYTDLGTGKYGAPVYRFDTYEEFLHLLDITGMYEILNYNLKEPRYYDYSHEVAYYKYCEEFFEDHSLLLGWVYFEGRHGSLDGCYYHNNLYNFEYGFYVSCDDLGNKTVFDSSCHVENGSLEIEFRTHTNCCSSDSKQLVSALVWIPILKSDLEKCNSISIVLIDNT